MNHRLKDSVVVITGASSGIGIECARLFAAAGSRLVVSARREEILEALAKELQPAQCLVLPLDLSKLENAQRLVDETITHYGRIDALVNNAGYAQVDPLESIPPEDLERIFCVNFFSPFLAIRAAIPHMRRQGCGHIINVSSIVGHRGIPFFSSYSATKAALIRMTESLRVELAGTGIDVSLVCPAITKTEFVMAQVSRNHLDSHTPQFGMTSRQVAQSIVKLATHPRREIVLSFVGHLTVWLNRLVPAILEMGLRRYRDQVMPKGDKFR